jgi:hypothetical protein
MFFNFVFTFHRVPKSFFCFRRGRETTSTESLSLAFVLFVLCSCWRGLHNKCNFRRGNPKSQWPPQSIQNLVAVRLKNLNSFTIKDVHGLSDWFSIVYFLNRYIEWKISIGANANSILKTLNSFLRNFNPVLESLVSLVRSEFQTENLTPLTLNAFRPPLPRVSLQILLLSFLVFVHWKIYFFGKTFALFCYSW